MQQAQDFWDIHQQLYALVADLPDDQWPRESQFKGWTITDIIRHLHFWDDAVLLALQEPEKFAELRKKMIIFMGKGASLPAFEASILGDLSPAILREKWHDCAVSLKNGFADADPKARIPWVGPDMGARSAISARIMENWAHGQAIYDLLGKTRDNGDALYNIVILGVNAYGWTFKNRKLPVPEPIPFVALTAPSGKIWTLGDEAQQGREHISGSAEEFCQVVTQCRNIADTNLSVTGENATQWMAIAQCFAGAPVDPPAAGTRHKI